MPRKITNKTKEEITNLIKEYFNDDVGGGWSITTSTDKNRGKIYHNIIINFKLLLDKEVSEKNAPSISVFFPTYIEDGTPKVEWENEIRNLLERISREFTGDVEQTLLSLEEIIQQEFDAPTTNNRRTIDEFKEQVGDLDLWRYKKYAAAVTWDDWEMMMCAEEQKNKTIVYKNNGKKEK